MKGNSDRKRIDNGLIYSLIPNKNNIFNVNILVLIYIIFFNIIYFQ